MDELRFRTGENENNAPVTPFETPAETIANSTPKQLQNLYEGNDERNKDILKANNRLVDKAKTEAELRDLLSTANTKTLQDMRAAKKLDVSLTTDKSKVIQDYISDFRNKQQSEQATQETPNNDVFEVLNNERERLQDIIDKQTVNPDYFADAQKQTEIGDLAVRVNNIEDVINSGNKEAAEKLSAELGLSREATDNNASVNPFVAAEQEPKIDNSAKSKQHETATTEAKVAPAVENPQVTSENENVDFERKDEKTKQTERTEEEIRENVKRQLIDVGQSDEVADGLSQIYVAMNKFFAKYTGNSLSDMADADGLNFEYQEYIKDIVGDSGRVITSRAQAEFRDGETLIRVSKIANESSVLHEFGHLFLRKFRNLATADKLKGLAKQDWNTIIKSYGLEKIDFANMSDDDIKAWNDSHERFATDLERYFRTGEAPNAKLKHVFENFKKWLTEVYKSMSEIFNVSSDGREHSFKEVTPEMREIFKVFDDMLGGRESGEKTGGRVETEQTKLKTENENNLHKSKSSELIVNSDGSTALAYIDANIAEVAGISEGEIQANIGVLKHAEIRHGEQIRKAGYKDVQTFMFDVLDNWDEIRQGSNGSLWLIMPHDGNHVGVSAIQLHQKTPGIYRVSTLIFTRNRALRNKKLLYTGRSTPVPSSGSGLTLTSETSDIAETSTPKNDSSIKQSSGKSLDSNDDDVKSESLKKYKALENTEKLTPEQIAALKADADKGILSLATINSLSKKSANAFYEFVDENYEMPDGYYFVDNSDVNTYLLYTPKGQIRRIYPRSLTSIQAKRGIAKSNALTAENKLLNEDGSPKELKGDITNTDIKTTDPDVRKMLESRYDEHGHIKNKQQVPQKKNQNISEKERFKARLKRNAELIKLEEKPGENLGKIDFSFRKNGEKISKNIFVNIKPISETYARLIANNEQTADRMTRYMGDEIIELRYSDDGSLDGQRGNVVAIYSPMADEFLIENFRPIFEYGEWNENRSKQLEQQFREQLPQILRDGNFLAKNGELKSDGNEDYRRKVKEWKETQGYTYNPLNFDEEAWDKEHGDETGEKHSQSLSEKEKNDILEKRNSAQEMINEKIPAKIIKMATGWEKISDDEWHWEGKNSAGQDTKVAYFPMGNDRYGTGLSQIVRHNKKKIKAILDAPVGTQIFNIHHDLDKYRTSNREIALRGSEQKILRWIREDGKNGKSVVLSPKNVRDAFEHSETFLYYPTPKTAEEIAQEERDMEELMKNIEREYQKRQRKQKGEKYNQALRRDIDLDENVDVVKISSTLDNVPFYQRMKAFGKDKRAELLKKFKDGIVNKHTGLKITLSNKGLAHILDTTRNTDNESGKIAYQALPSLDELAENAYRVETHNDKKPAPGTEGQAGILKQVHRFLVPINLDGEQHILKLTAKEYENGKTEVDGISLYDMKYTKKMPVHPSKDSPNSIGRATQTLGDPDTVSVREMLEGVNDSDGNPFIKQGKKVEIYNQILGEKGARELDKQEGVTTHMDNLALAKELTEENEDAKTIRLATGWELGRDNKWRWEIMDGNFDWQKVYDAVNQDDYTPADAIEYPLSEIFENKELFKAYPELKEMPVIFDILKKNTSGLYNSQSNKISISLSQTPDDMQSSLIHEIQHAIQYIEGFALGGKPQDLTREYKKISQQWKKKADKIRENFTSKEKMIMSFIGEHNMPYTEAEKKEVIEDLTKLRGYTLQDMKRVFDYIEARQKERKYHGWSLIETSSGQFDTYINYQGEIEARNAQTRENFTAGQRRNRTLRSTEDLDNDARRIIRQIDSKGREVYNQAARADDAELNAKEQLEAVRKQYQGTDKWLKAPNGKKSNLNEKQWLQVRTPNFKRWFGNWNYDGKEPIKVSEINSANLPFNWKDTKDIKQWLRANFAGREVTINSDGNIVGFSSRGLGDSLKNRGEEQRGTYSKLEDIIKNAAFFDFREVDNKAKHEHLKGQDLYYSAIKFNGDIYPVQIILDVNKETQRDTYKGHKVIKDIKISSAVYMAETENGVPSQTKDMLTVTLADLTNGVKPENVSKVVDDNGEPLVVYHGTDYGGFSVFNTVDVAGRNTGAFFSSEDRASYYHHDDENKIIKLPPEFKSWNDVKEYAQENNIEFEKDDDPDIEGYLLNGEWVNNFKDAREIIHKVNRENNNVGNIYACFLDIKNPNVINAKGEWAGNIDQIRENDEQDGVIVHSVVDGSYDGGQFEDTNYVVFSPEQVKSASDNRGTFDANNPEIYSQAFNPRKSIAEWFRKSSAKIRDLITSSVESKPKTKERPSLSFENETSERGYTENNREARTPSPKVRLNNFLHKLVKSFSGDHANLNEKNLLAAKQEFRLLKQRQSAAAKQAMKTFAENLGGLDAYEKDLFGRAMFLLDHSWRKSKVPDAKLPFGFTDSSLKKERERFQKLVDENPKVKKAIEAEQATNKKITREFLKYAHELGFEIDDIFNNPYYYRHIVLEYADLAGLGANKDGWTGGNSKRGNSSDPMHIKMREILGRDYMKRYKGSEKDISTDYVYANNEVRAQMLSDIETMKTMKKIKSQYDKSAEYRDLMREAIFGNGKKFSQGEGVNLSDIIPDGYELYSPAGSGLVKMANSVHENVIIQGLQDASDKYGLPLDEVLTAGAIDDEEIFNQLWVIPKAIKDTFKDMAKDNKRGLIGSIVKRLTGAWKTWETVGNPLRMPRFFTRNFSGDLDAVIAGNPGALKYALRAIKELTSKNPTQDLKDFLERRGENVAIGDVVLEKDKEQLLFDFVNDDLKKLKEAAQQAKDGKKISRTLLAPLRKFFSWEVGINEWRENILRYAAYLSYLENMKKNKGIPSR